MQKFKAFLSDIDGTLLDTSEFIFQAYEHTLKKHGLPPKTRSEISAVIGASLESCYEALAPGANVQLLCEDHRDFQANHIDLARPFPGALTTLETLKVAGLKIAAVTTRSRSTSIETLRTTGMFNYIDYVVALEDVVHLKPHSEPVVKALTYLDIKPECAVMVGDSDVDIVAGRRAGTVTIGAAYGFHGMRIADCNPDYIIDAIEEVVPLVLPVTKIWSGRLRKE